MNRFFSWLSPALPVAAIASPFFLAAVVFLGMGLWATRAPAADATLGWTLPTQNTDNSAIPATGAGSLVSTRIEWGTCSGTAFGTKAGEAVVPTPATTYVVTDLAPATWCFRLFAKNTYGIEGGPSNVVSKVAVPPTPKPPVLTVTTLAYDLTFTGSIGRLVGNVEPGTACVGDVIKTWKDGSTFYEVPLASVSLTREPRSTRVVAKCAAAEA